jgi:hypothetical protein
MQTFLPYNDFEKSAQVLDRQRLGKQRVEVLQLLKALAGETKGWVNHPAAKMWRGYENALAIYGMVICTEWIKRGYKDTCFAKIMEYRNYDRAIVVPKWLGREDFHASHRSNLLRKNPEYYSQFGWDESPDLPYVWE